MANARPNPFGCYDRRYLIEVLPALALMAIGLLLLQWLPRSPGRRVLLLGLGSAGLAWILVVTVAALRRLDELQQRIHLIAIAVSFTATGVLFSVMPLFPKAAASPMFSVVVWTFMMMTWAVSVGILNRRYR